MADDYSNSELANMVKGSQSPAAPAGLQQTLAAGAGAAQGESQYAGSKLAQWVNVDEQGRPGAAGGAQSWFTGANTGGPMNGWNTEFVDTFQAQYDAAAEEGTLAQMFDRDGATGVVTYDHASEKDEDKVYQFGDIYENGKLQGNVYQLYDRDTANLMMSSFLLSADEQKKAFKDAKPGELAEGEIRAPGLEAAINEKRAWNEENLARAYAAQAFETKVQGTEKEFTEGYVDEAIVGGGALGGAATGAGTGAVIGSVVPGAGTAVGATVGSIVGGTAGFIGAYLNKDALVEQAARAKEITDAAEEQFNSAAAFSTGVHQWSKFGMKLISPASNLVQGGVDAAGQSRVGDGEADFYKVDDKGERTTSKFLIAADIGATVADGLLQFASPVGLAAYSGLMAGTVGGQVGELALSGGNTFDDRSGTFDNVFTDEKGNFDASSAAAGIGVVGVDAVQLGFARGLAGKVNATRASVGQDAAFATAPGALGRQTTGRLPKWLGGNTDKAAAAGAVDEVRIGGFAYALNETGEAVSRRATLSLLAPSEVLTSLGAKVMARRHVARAQGAISTDDIYRTATAMASGEMKLQTAMVNAMGEGSEEMLQSALEPLSHGADLDAAEIYLSGLYGAAGGLGMGMAANLHIPSQREILEAQAKTAHFLMTDGQQMDEATAKGMSDDELRKLASTMNSAQRQVASTASQKAVDSLTATNVAGVWGETKLRDAIATQRDSELARATARTDAAFVITPLEAAGAVDKDGNLKFGSIPSDGIASSARQMLKNYSDRLAGARIQSEELTLEMQRVDPADAEQLAKITADAGIAQGTVEWMERIAPRLVAAVEKIDREQDLATKAADVAELNHQLRLWFSGVDNDFFGELITDVDKRMIQRAVSMVWARDPHDSAGSYPVLVPQVSLQLTTHQADNVMQVSSGILKAIRGDHDGDKLRPLNQLWLDDDAFESARSGAWYVGTGSAVHVDPPKQEAYLVEYISKSLDSTASQALQVEAMGALTNITSAVRKRYAGLGVDAQLDRVNQRFFDAVKANTKDARAVLLDGLADEIGGVLNDYARRSMSNEWLWLDQLVRSNLQAFQEVYVAHVGLPGREVDDLSDLPGAAPRKVARSRKVNERIGRRAATFGQTMSLWLVGESPFRMFQKLHYSSIQSPVLSAAQIEPMSITEMAEEYERLGQLIVQSELDRVRGVDDITARVQGALEVIAADAEAQTALAASDPNLNVDGGMRRLSKSEALVVVANTAVRDFEYNPERDEYRATGTISLAQMLLKLAVQRDQREKAQILAASPSLQAKHARLLELTRPGGGNKNSPVNAEKAFVEVFGSQTMAALLGEEASVFGPQVTLEQYIRSYSAMSPEERKFAKQELTLDNPAYIGRNRPKNVPYDLAEVVADEITPFRSVVDSILAVGNARDFEFAERSKVVSKQFAEAHESVRESMKQMLQLSPKRGELPVDLVQRVLDENPDFARRVAELIPNATAAAVFEVRDGQVYVNNWFYEMFAEKSAKKAEMIYWRAMLLESWRALSIRTGDDDAAGREYDRLKRRMHRVMYRVAPEKAKDAGVLLRTFTDALFEFDDVDKFIEWVNETPGMRAEHEAPLVAWFDDVAEFDVDKTNGGWTTSLAGAELREAIKLLQQSSNNLKNELLEERALKKQDDSYLRAIDRVIANRNGTGKTLSAGDEDVYRSLEEAISRAGELAVTLGPHAMVFQSVANAWGFYGQAHTKGKNPAHVEAYGMFDARRDAFGFLHNYSRVMGALTAVDIDAVGSNLNMVAKDSGRAMDDYGNVVEWGKPTVEQMARLLRDPKTRPMARAILFPTVLERTDDGQLSEQMLFGKSMQDLLEGSSYDDLFPAYDVLSQQSAFKYVALVESMSRQFGGHMSLSRTVNDVVIARLQAATQTLTFEQVEEMVTTAYYETAKLLQKVASVAAKDQVEGVDTLTGMKTAVKQARRERHLRNRLGGNEEFAVIFQAEMDVQYQRDLNELTAAAAANPARQAEILAHADRLTVEYDLYKERLAMLLEGDEVGTVQAAYAYPMPGTLTPDELDRHRVAVQRKIVEYIDNHPTIRERVPSVTMEVGKLQFQLGDPDNFGEVEMTEVEWDKLSRAIISLILTDSAGPVGMGASVRLFPDEKNLGDIRYYDQSFSYLIDNYLDPASPILQAAARLHVLAKRHEEIAEISDIEWTIDNTILDDRKLGPWTPEVVIASVEANQRIDSAAAAPAVAISGSSPKLEATVSAATARTFEMPGDELLSTVKLLPSHLERPLFDEVEMTLPGGIIDTRPLAQLNNRFAKSVTATLPDGTVIDLLAENPDLGRYWRGNASGAQPGLGVPVEIHLDRIAEALRTSATNRGIKPESLSVDVAFFHPETQPAGEQWYNNLWFEGTSFKLDADRHSSLNETLWFALGSLSPEGQAAALDAAKTGKQAMQVIKAPSAGDRADDEAGWETDLARVLRRKTQRILETDLGFGALDPEFYNAVHKGLKLRHFVIQTNGAPITAEQAIEMQRAGEIVEGELWTPSDKVLRSMLGEQGDEGVSRVFDDQIDFDNNRIPRYRGLSDTMLARFREGLTGGKKRLEDTRIVNRGRQSTLTVRPMVSQKWRDQFATRLRKLAEFRNTEYVERTSRMGSDAAFNPRNNLTNALERAYGSIESENLQFAFRSLGIPFVGPRKAADSEASKTVLRELSALQEPDGKRTGWILRKAALSDFVSGVLGQVPLAGEAPRGLNILLGDIVVMELDSYGEGPLASQDAMKDIDRLATLGATVVLSDPSGGSNLRGEMAAYVRSLGYEKVAGSKHVYRPLESSSEYIVQGAREDTLMEVRGVSPVGRALVFNAYGVPMQEGGAWVNPRTEKLGSIKVVNDLLPISSMGGFGIPQRTNDVDSQVDRVIRHLQGLDDSANLQVLREMSKITPGSQADRDMTRAWARMMARFANPDNGVLPSYDDMFEIGDMIPLVDNNGHILIYRHGNKRPSRAELKAMFRRPLPGRERGGGNVAIYFGDAEPAATVHSGHPVEFKERAGYGLSVELEVPLQVFGDKQQLEWDGTKYTIVPWPDASQPGSPVLPDTSVLENMDISLVSDYDTRAGKEGAESVVNSHRNAFALLGMDFLPDVTEFFFPGQGADISSQQMTREILRFWTNVSDKIDVDQAHEFINLTELHSAFESLLPELTEYVTSAHGLSPNWMDALGEQGTVEAQITMAVLGYLSVAGTKSEDILKSGAFDDTSAGPDAQSRLMPRLFTQVFDNAKIGSPLRTEINRRLNARLGKGYRLLQNFDMVIDSGIPGKKMTGFLSFPELHSSGDNPVTNGMSFRDGTTQQVSMHSAMVADQAIGARTFASKLKGKAQEFKDTAFGGGKIERFTPGVYDDGGVWNMLSDVPARDRTYDAWSAPLPAELERRGIAYDAMVKFRSPIDTEGDHWSALEKKTYDEHVRKILDTLNLPSSMSGLVDGWVRQMSGRPAGMLVDGMEVEPVTGQAGVEWARAIRDNVSKGFSPVMGGYVPLLHVHDLKHLYRAQQTAGRPWPFRTSMDETTEPARSWDDWVHASLGSGLATEVKFQRIYLLPVDGFMHSYLNSTRDISELPVSVDVLVTNQVLSMETNRLLQVVTEAEIAEEELVYDRIESIDPRVQRLLENPLVLDTARATLTDLLNGQRIAGEFRGEAAPASAKGKQDAHLRRHRKESGLPTPVAVSMKDFRKNSTEFLYHTTTTNSLVRGLLNLRVGTALLNPALYVSMPIELMVRGSLDRVANILTGTNSTGMLQAKAAAGINALPGLGELTQAAGLQTLLTPEQVTKVRRLLPVMGSDPEFKALIYKDLNYHAPVEQGTSKLGRGLAAYAKAGSRVQDPTHMMRGDALARRYFEGALSHIVRSGTLSGIGIDQLIDELQQSPTFLSRAYPEASVAGSNTIAQIRSIKDTPLSLALRWIYEPMSQNPNSPMLNMFGNLVLRMPMMFSGYLGNVATTILGLQGVSDMTAAFLDGKAKGPGHIFGRISAKMRGDEFSPEIDGEFDMSSVLEGVDLARSFLRGSLTHTGLFTLAMMSGGLGLSGEDDEMKRRRRAAELQGGAVLYDPRKIENDFRNADAIYLDWLPFGWDSYFTDPETGRAMAQTHWMLKQFISPIVGIEKFMETGNFNHVKWGFMDALGSFPLINSNTISDTFETMALFEKQAADLALEGTDEANVKAAGLLTSVVGSYEKMLFENAFLSALYVGLDEYDRDPYAQVLLDSNGDIQVDGLGEPRQTTRLQTTVDPKTGAPMTTYLSRPDSKASLATLTENRPTLAMASMLFTGLGDSEYWRYNMVPKIREIEKPTVTEPMAQAYLLAAFKNVSGMRNLSVDEALDQIKAEYRARGEWYDGEESIMPEARRRSAMSGGAALSMMTNAGEQLTDDGAKAIFQGLRKGSLSLEDPELARLYVSYPMREQIMNDWTKELTAEGVSMGLSQSDAVSRTKRLLYGPFGQSDATGLADLLFSDKISASPKNKYYQLNTTYVMGPDGRPWATGWKRDGAKGGTGIFGSVLGLAGVMPLKRMIGAGEGMGKDSRGNSVDLVSGLNTGLRGLVPIAESPPTAEEIGKAIEKAIAEAAKQDYSGFAPFPQRAGSGYGYRRYGGYTPYKRRSYGSGGGYSSSGYPNFTRMYSLPKLQSPYSNDIPFINTSNPILRRADIRRERVWSERGRLNQWQ